MATQSYKSELKGINGEKFRIYWDELGEQSENTVRVFVRGDVFTLHDKDTEYVQKIINIENTIKSERR
jgi:hypothetical protein